MSILRAAFSFWLTLAVSAAAVISYETLVLGDVGGPEWGNPGQQVFLGIIIYAIIVVVPAGFHAVAIILLRRLAPAIAPALSAASSALSAVAVRAAGIALFLLAPKEADWPILVVIGPFPFVLTLLVVPLAGRLRKPDAQWGAGQ